MGGIVALPGDEDGRSAAAELDEVASRPERAARRVRGTSRRVARRLVDAAVAWARETGTRVVTVCPYARSVFDKDASIRDVLAER